MRTGKIQERRESREYRTARQRKVPWPPATTIFNRTPNRFHHVEHQSSLLSPAL
jgi:hypothetical protein